jgi:hypothetical protein
MTWWNVDEPAAGTISDAGPISHDYDIAGRIFPCTSSSSCATDEQACAHQYQQHFDR